MTPVEAEQQGWCKLGHRAKGEVTDARQAGEIAEPKVEPQAASKISRMAPRRTCNSSRTSRSSRPCRQKRRSSTGSTRSLLTMIASAMVQTITMPVAAEVPPRNASIAMPSKPRAIGRLIT